MPRSKIGIIIITSIMMFSAPATATPPPVAQCLKTHILPANTVKKSSSRDITLELEVASTPKAREQGLMDRKRITPCDGMAFFFPATLDNNLGPQFTPQKFWMKDTLLPLDIIFIDPNNIIVSIVAGKPLSEEPLGPDTPIATVIEIDAGRAKREGIAVGDRVYYEIQVPPYRLAR